MKKLMYVCIAGLLMTVTVHAQENKEVKETTKVKKVVKRDTKVEVKVIKETDKEIGTVKVEGTNAQDQKSKVVTEKMDGVEVIADETLVDAENAARAQAIQTKKRMELEASIAAQKAKAEKERQMLMEKKRQREADLEAKRQALESRPKGMAKLDKDRNKDNQ